MLRSLFAATGSSIGDSITGAIRHPLRASLDSVRPLRQVATNSSIVSSYWEIRQLWGCRLQRKPPAMLAAPAMAHDNLSRLPPNDGPNGYDNSGSSSNMAAAALTRRSQSAQRSSHTPHSELQNSEGQNGSTTAGAPASYSFPREKLKEVRYLGRRQRACANSF
jgi:hypothetical protein